MRDVTDQMTTYFDATVERVTAEDVLAGAEVRSQSGRRAPNRVPRLRPAWVVAAGFAATIVLIGGAVGVARLFEGDSSDVGAVSQVGDAGDGLAGSWALLIAAGVILALAVAGLVWRSRKEIVKEQTMQTLERPEVEVSPLPRSPVILILLVALLALAAGVLGWWIGSSGDDGAAAEVPEIVDLVNQAWVDGDADAVAALIAEDGIWLSAPDGQFAGRDEIRTMVAAGMRGADFEEMTVESIVVLDNINLIAYQWNARGTSSGPFETAGGPFETTGVSVFEIEDGLIARWVLYYDSDELFFPQSD